MPDTDLITSKLIKDKERIWIREFFEYDTDNLLRRTILDDGTSPDPHNLIDVTERKIRRMDYNKRGLLESLEDKYEEKGTECLLRKTVYTYSKEGWVEKEAVYDAEGAFCYELETHYNPMGLPIFHKDALGRVTVSDYDVLGNKKYIKEPSDKEQWYLYDAESRLESLKEKDVDGKERFTQ